MDIKNYIEGNWHEIKGSLKKTFGKLTDNDWTTSEGSFEKLMGSIQKAYSISKDEAEKMVMDFKKGHFKENKGNK